MSDYILPENAVVVEDDITSTNLETLGQRKMREDRQAAAEEADLEHGRRGMSPFGHLFRFLGRWFGFTGLYSMFAVCPFCGQQGCPVGLASAGTVGAFFALCTQDWKILYRFLKQKLTNHAKEEKF